MIRAPAVAGQFYPATSQAVGAALDGLLHAEPAASRAIAVMVPHAGWEYSGRTAGAVFSRVAVPDRVILLGPNHAGTGAEFALMDAGAWQTPVAPVPIAEPLTAMLLDRCESLAADARAHAREHSLEVHLPLLQRRNPAVQIAPVVIGGTWPWSGGRAALRELGQGIAAAVREYGRPVLLVASTDLNHYEDQETARIKDKLVLDAVLALDEDGLMQRVIDVEVSMCGVAPTYVMLVAAKLLGARQATLVEHCTSGDITGDYSRVVGYGGVVLQ
jgi:AmmeMemoRadiSam system protein B